MTGTIVKVMGRYYTLNHEGKDSTAVLRGKFKVGKVERRFSEPLAVGDLVDFDPDGENLAVITKIHERRNVFTRKDKNRELEDFIAANIDQIVVVQSFNSPRINLRFVDRLIVRGVKEHIPAVLCANKVDLAQEGDREFVEQYYRGLKMPIFYTNALTKEGVDEISAHLKGKVSIFIGYSGVGKSTILNDLFPGLGLRTSDVSMSTGKGRHTTTNVEMVCTAADTYIIDTPGMREFGLMDIRPEELSGFFPDFRKYSEKCRFTPCSHDHEPGCEIKNRDEKGNIHEERYISYMNILYSLKEYHDNKYR